MQSTDELVQDHTLIEKVLSALQREIDRAHNTNSISAEFVGKICKFSQAFIDGCHHRKEEVCLFPCLSKCGIPSDEGPVRVMLEEHEMGRMLVKEILGKLDLYIEGSSSVESVVDLCERYVELLVQHIQKENGILFPMSDQVLKPRDDEENMMCYQRKKDEIGNTELARLLARAEELSAN